MGRSIGGAVVGFISYYLGIGIIIMILAFIIGADGIRDATTKEPTMVWLLLATLMSAALAYLAAVITRAIAKAPLGTFIFAGLLVLLIIYSLTSRDPEALKKLPPNMPPVMTAMIEAQINTPMLWTVLGFVVTFGAVALGGLNKGDFAKKTVATTDWSEPPKPENPA